MPDTTSIVIHDAEEAWQAFRHVRGRSSDERRALLTMVADAPGGPSPAQIVLILRGRHTEEFPDLKVRFEQLSVDSATPALLHLALQLGVTGDNRGRVLQACVKTRVIAWEILRQSGGSLFPEELDPVVRKAIQVEDRFRARWNCAKFCLERFREHLKPDLVAELEAIMAQQSVS